MAPEPTGPPSATEQSVQEGQYSRILYYGCACAGYPILDRITGAWKARGRPLQEGLEEGLTVQNITDLANTGSFNTRGSWKLSLLFKDAHPVGTHRRCEHDQVWQEIYPGPYRCHVPEAIWPVESAIERLDSMESAATTRIDSKAKTVTIQQPDLTVIFHAANASIGEHTARIALSNTLSELGIPVLDIVAPSPTEHSSAPHEYTFGRYIGLEQFMSMTPAEMHLYLVGIIGPYAAKARRAAYACRNQSETYQGPWWSQDGNQTAEAMSCVPDVLEDHTAAELPGIPESTKMNEDMEWDNNALVPDTRDVEKGAAVLGHEQSCPLSMPSRRLRRRRRLRLFGHSMLIVAFLVWFFGADPVRRIQGWLRCQI